MELDKYILVGHEPIVEPDLMKWAEWWEKHHALRHIAVDEINDKRVSTVFLGINHKFFGGGQPLLFETMVFTKGSWADEYMERYYTWDEAARGHKRIVNSISRKIKLVEDLT